MKINFLKFQDLLVSGLFQVCAKYFLCQEYEHRSTQPKTITTIKSENWEWNIIC